MRHLNDFDTHKMVATIISFGVFLLFGCTQPLTSSEQDPAVEANKYGFAYDAKFDQLGYMTCSEMSDGTYDPSQYFSFRLGAYTTDGGIRVSQDFLTSTEKRSFDRKVEYLTTGQYNLDTTLQLALRPSSNFQQLFANAATPAVGVDYANMFLPLGTIELSQVLLQAGTNRVRYQRTGEVAGARMEGSVYFTNGSATGESLRQFMSNTGLLAVTYKQGDLDYAARGPSDITGGTVGTNKSVYGVGYRVRFGQPVPSNSGIFAGYPNYAVQQVRELNLTDLTDTTGVGSWTCPYRFKIYRIQDINGAIPCVKHPDSANGATAQQNSEIRNILKSEDWYVDFTNKCIIPKKSGGNCYGTDSATVVNYDATAACTAAPSTSTCAHIVTICVRQ